jgi:hypothetical protein
MTLHPTLQAEEHLRDVAQQFTQWRQTRANPRSSRIPEPLWAEAIALAAAMPLPRVARALGLKSHALKRRCGDGLSATGSKPPAPAFVEVSAAAEPPTTVEVEVVRPDGSRLRITYQNPTPALAPLLQTFLEHR